MLTSKEAVTLVVISSLFVIVILYLMPHMQETMGALSCGNFSKGKYSGYEFTTCCDTQTDKEGIEITWCTVCQTDEAGEVFNCGPRFQPEQGFQPPLPPSGHLNGGITLSPSNTTNSTTQPPGGLLNGRIPTGKLGNAPPPITTFNAPVSGNTSSPTNNTTTTAMKAVTGASSPTGYCGRFSRTTCIPCDPGLPEGKYNCIPQGEWPPPSTGIPVIQQPGTLPPSIAGKLNGNPIISQPNNGTKIGNTGNPILQAAPPTTTSRNNNAANLYNTGNTLEQQQREQPLQTPQQQQPTTTTCHDGSTPDANGNCPSSTTANQLAPPSPTPSEQHHHKGNNALGQTGGGETTTTTKKGKVPKADQGTIQPHSK